MKRIGLLGSTGSIGTQTLDIIREHREEFELITMSVGLEIWGTVVRVPFFQAEDGIRDVRT